MAVFQQEVLGLSSSFEHQHNTAASLGGVSKTMYPFKVGAQYTRKEIFDVLGISDPRGGNWYTGYVSHGHDWFIFCGIGTPGRTGHDYHNRFLGENLVWFGKTGTNIRQPAIQQLLKPKGRVYVFYRDSDRAPFVFAGIARAKSVKDSSPVQIVWSFVDDISAHPEMLPEEVSESQSVFEGCKKTVTVNIYERDPSARRKCIAHWGILCSVCDFDFARIYGQIGAGFIHVHHLRPLSDIGERYELDPITDLRPVCPNCHAMLHRASPPMTIESLRSIIQFRSARKS